MLDTVAPVAGFARLLTDFPGLSAITLRHDTGVSRVRGAWGRVGAADAPPAVKNPPFTESPTVRRVRHQAPWKDLAGMPPASIQ